MINIDIFYNHDSLPKESGIYLIHFNNGKSYVGQAGNIRHRFKTVHLKFKNLKKKAVVHQAMNLHIWSVSVLEFCAISELDNREIFWIREKEGYAKGYNCNLGGGGNRGFKFSEESKIKKSLSMKGMKGTRLGQKQTKEEKLKRSITMTETLSKKPKEEKLLAMFRHWESRRKNGTDRGFKRPLTEEKLKEKSRKIKETKANKNPKEKEEAIIKMRATIAKKSPEEKRKSMEKHWATKRLNAFDPII
jgi:group I intron endonuclease